LFLVKRFLWRKEKSSDFRARYGFSASRIVEQFCLITLHIIGIAIGRGFFWQKYQAARNLNPPPPILGIVTYPPVLRSPAGIKRVAFALHHIIQATAENIIRRVNRIWTAFIVFGDGALRA